MVGHCVICRAFAPSGLSGMELRKSPAKLQHLDGSPWGRREVRREQPRRTATRADGRGSHLGGLDVGNARHHQARRHFRAERRSYEADARQPEHRAEGVDAQRCVVPWTGGSQGHEAALLSAPRDFPYVRLLRESGHEPLGLPTVPVGARYPLGEARAIELSACPCVDLPIERGRFVTATDGCGDERGQVLTSECLRDLTCRGSCRIRPRAASASSFVSFPWNSDLPAFASPIGARVESPPDCAASPLYRSSGYTLKARAGTSLQPTVIFSDIDDQCPDYCHDTRNQG